MKKRKAAVPYISVPRTNHFPETGNQDPVYRQWLVGIRRIVAKFIAEKAERSHQSPDEANKTPLTITEQINLREQLQRMGAGTGESVTAVISKILSDSVLMSST
jgi:hypothetical protein